MKKYSQKPNTPKILDDVGKKFWALYCEYFLDRDYLTADLLPDIEHLSHLQQQRVRLQEYMSEDDDSANSMLQELRLLSGEIRQYKSHLKIKVRASEFKKKDSEKKKTETENNESNVFSLTGKNY